MERVTAALARQPCVAQPRPAPARRRPVQCTAQGGQPQEPRPSRRGALLAAGFGLVALPSLARGAAADGDAVAPPPQQQPGEPGSSAPAAPGAEAQQTRVPMNSEELEQAAAAKLLDEEEARRKARRRTKGRIRELEELRAELAEKELVLLEKEAELLEKEQTLMVLREELEIERKLRSLLTKQKEKAEEEAALAMGLCTGSSMLP